MWEIEVKVIIKTSDFQTHKKNHLFINSIYSILKVSEQHFGLSQADQ